ncbi:hypothetical protein AAFF_G00339170 [Aldrovandia affinis]|uniref:Major facilitator superfamily associated domain-containing protein n=1 Tax=Aldrovandia affinis TaxID=143900 RepID=A0AAD7WQ10_9TELE|nr:hypothetical protein AAFF_G00339170 [Aldrovandia affinis]
MQRNDGQWDVTAASALAGTFHFLYSCSRACLFPFLTLYLRHLGLTATMVGVVMATRHLIILAWGPVSAHLARHYNQRRVVVTGSLLCSVAVSLLFLLIPPTDMAVANRHCNITRLWADAEDSGYPGNVTAMAGYHMAPVSWDTADRTLTVTGGDGISRTEVTVTRTSNAGASNTVAAPAINYIQEINGTLHTANRADGGRRILEGPQTPAPNSSVGFGRGQRVTGASAGNISRSSSPRKGIRSMVKRESKLEEEEEEVVARYEFLGSLKVMDAPHQLFFLVLMGVALWEGVATPLERAADDGLYEYLDFVDAAERQGAARVWGLLGAAGGVCGTGVLVGGLGCLIGARTPRSAVHFFAYALLNLFAIPAAVFLPMYLSTKREPAGRALKVLQQVRADPRAMLCVATAFLAGAAGSAIDDFLLWQMQDRGSSELHMGVALGVALLSQVLFHLLASARVSRLLSHGTAMAVGVACLGLQCLYYSFLWSAWSVLPAQALSVASAGALWWAVEGQCKGVATPETERCVRGAVREVAARVGAGLGSLVAGLVVERFTVAILFQGAAVVLLPWGLGLPAVLCRLPQRRRVNYSRLLAADGSEQSESESEAEKDWLVKAMQEDKNRNNNNSRDNGW